jgi:hypothetical protein
MEDPKEISLRLKRLSIIRELKSHAIQEQVYEYASEIRDIERDIERDIDIVKIDNVNFLKSINKFIDKIYSKNTPVDVERRAILLSELREYKLNILNIN